MVKTLHPLQEFDLVKKAAPVLRMLLCRIPGLIVESNEESVLQQPGLLFQPDLVFKTQLAQGEPWSLVCEFKQHAEPRHMRLAAYEIRDRVQNNPARHIYAVLVVPYISEAAAKICEEVGIGYADLAGNARLAFGSTFIFTHGYENPFRVRREKNLYAPKSGRVLQALLREPRQLWKVTDLAETAQVSLGQVSNVRRALLDREWAGLTEGRVFLKRPEELLKDWRENYKSLAATTRRAYSLLHGSDLDEALSAAIAKAGAKHLLLASYSSAKWLAPFARVSTQYIYADSIGEQALDEVLKLEPAVKGENVIIMRPKDEGVFMGPVDGGLGLWCTSPTQTFLDLSIAGERGREASDFLLDDYIRKRWAIES